MEQKSLLHLFTPSESKVIREKETTTVTKSSTTDESKRKNLGCTSPSTSTEKTNNIPKGITDVDVKYFKIVQEQSQRYKIKRSKKEYINILNDCLRQNIQTGIVHDEISKIEELTKLEQMKLKQIRCKLAIQKSEFETFLNQDYTKSLKLLSIANNEADVTKSIRTKLIEKLQKQGTIEQEINNIYEAYEKSVMYTEIIDSITPTNKLKKQVLPTQTTNVPRTKNHVLEKLEADLQYQKSLKPKLYFTNPLEIYQLFKDLEVQNIKLFVDLSASKRIIQLQQESLNLIEKILLHNSFLTVAKIQEVQQSIELRESQIKSEKDLVNTLLNYVNKGISLGHEDAVVYGYLCGTHKIIFERDTINLSSVNMIRDIQDLYLRLIHETECLVPQSQYLQLVKTLHNNQEKKLRKSKECRKSLMDLDILVARTVKLLDKPQKNVGRKLMTRSYTKVFKQKAKLSPQKIETKEALLLKHLFTEECVTFTSQQLFEDDKNYE